MAEAGVQTNARLPSISVVMMVMMMVVVVMARVVSAQMHDHAMVVMVMMVMVVVTELHGNLRDLFGRTLGKPRIVGFQHRHRIGDRVKKIPVTRRRCQFGTLRRRRPGDAGHCRQCGRSAQ